MALKRLRRVRNPLLRESLGAWTPSRPNSLMWLEPEIESEFLKHDPEIRAYWRAHVDREKADRVREYNLEREVFLSSNAPDHHKSRVGELFPPVDDTIPDSAGELKKEVNDAVNTATTKLYPSDWAKEKLRTISPDDAEYEYWNSLLSSVGEKEDKEHQEDLADLHDYLQDFYGSNNVSAVGEAIQNGRQAARQKFEKALQEIQSSIQQNKQKVINIAQSNLRYAEEQIKNNPAKLETTRRLWQSKIAEAEDLSRNDPRIKALLESVIPTEFKRSLDLRTLDLFKVDKATVDAFHKYPKERQARDAELQDLKEQLTIRADDYKEKFIDAAVEYSKKLDEIEAELNWMINDVPKMTIEQLFFRFPRWWAKRNWLMAHHRWDYTMSDAEYATKLRYDMTYWNLPRNP